MRFPRVRIRTLMIGLALIAIPLYAFIERHHAIVRARTLERELRAAWQRQAYGITSGSFTVTTFLYRRQHDMSKRIDRAVAVRHLLALPPEADEGALASMNEQLDRLGLALGSVRRTEVTVLGRRSANTVREPQRVTRTVFDGVDVACFDEFSRTASICHSPCFEHDHGYIDRDWVCHVPQLAFGSLYALSIEQLTDGDLLVRDRAGNSNGPDARVDGRSGFVKHLVYYVADRLEKEEFLQRDPIEIDGITLPGLIARLTTYKNKVWCLSIGLLKSHRINGPISASEFRVSVPAGTMITDNRDDTAPPVQFRTMNDVEDVKESHMPRRR